MKDAFSAYHPLINFGYFTMVILITMFMTQPYFLALSFAGSMTYSIYLNGKKAVKFNLLFMLPLLLIMTAMNPLFNHAGVTILTYFPSGNPLTLESIVYGFASAVMFVSIIMWFSCFNAVISSDKFIYLFGRIAPAISLILSMVLRFVPKYKGQIKKISEGQRCIGRDVRNGNIKEKAKNGIKIVSIMMTWALENGIETADSMRARGYGLPGRTSFSLYRFFTRDKIVMGILLVLLLALFVGFSFRAVYVLYYPAILVNETTVFAVITYIFYGILCFLPLILDIMEERRWHAMQSKI